MATHYISVPTSLTGAASIDLAPGSKVKVLDTEGERAKVEVLPLLPGSGAAGVNGVVPASVLRPVPTNINWLPLESNPDVLNSFMQRVGPLKEGWRFADVFGLEEELLAFIPQPCRALVLLHPGGGLVPAFRERRRALVAEYAASSQPAPPIPLYMTQHDEAGNACGTIAAIHAIANTGVPIEPGSILANFIASVSSSVSPALAGWKLLEESGLYAASDASAHTGDTATPEREADTDFHFIAFVNAAGRLWDLDGRKPHPVDCGTTSDESFLRDAATVIREQYMALAPECPNFSMLALCQG